MKRKLYIISVLLMIFGGALYYFNFDALGCALILLGSHYKNQTALQRCFNAV